MANWFTQLFSGGPREASRGEAHEQYIREAQERDAKWAAYAKLRRQWEHEQAAKVAARTAAKRLEPTRYSIEANTSRGYWMVAKAVPKLPFWLQHRGVWFDSYSIRNRRADPPEIDERDYKAFEVPATVTWGWDCFERKFQSQLEAAEWLRTWMVETGDSGKVIPAGDL